MRRVTAFAVFSTVLATVAVLGVPRAAHACVYAVAPLEVSLEAVEAATDLENLNDETGPLSAAYQEWLARNRYELDKSTPLPSIVGVWKQTTVVTVQPPTTISDERIRSGGVATPTQVWGEPTSELLTPFGHMIDPGTSCVWEFNQLGAVEWRIATDTDDWFEVNASANQAALEVELTRLFGEPTTIAPDVAAVDAALAESMERNARVFGADRLDGSIDYLTGFDPATSSDRDGLRIFAIVAIAAAALAGAAFGWNVKRDMQDL